MYGYVCVWVHVLNDSCFMRVHVCMYVYVCVGSCVERLGLTPLQASSHTLDAQERSADIYIYIYIYIHLVCVANVEYLLFSHMSNIRVLALCHQDKRECLKHTTHCDTYVGRQPPPVLATVHIDA